MKQLFSEFITNPIYIVTIIVIVIHYLKSQ